MFNLVIFGAPGSGKGTQSQKIIVKYQLIHLSTGDILREAIAQKTPLGVMAKSFMDRGELVPDDHVVNMVVQKLDGHAGAKGFIFDGFPRNLNQANILSRLLAERKSEVNVLITLEVDRNELIKRLQNRGLETGRADDQDLKVIENRLNVYHSQTSPVIEYYQKLDRHHPVDGMGTIDDIFGRISKVIDQVWS